MSVKDRVQAEPPGKGVWEAPEDRNGGLCSDPDPECVPGRLAMLLPLLLGRWRELGTERLDGVCGWV